MHIAFLIANNSYSPYFSWFADKCANQTKVKISFICLYNQEPMMMNEMKKKGCDFHFIYYDDRKRKSGIIKSFFKLLFLFKNIQPDIVHTHLFDDSLPGLFAARCCGIKARIITKQETGYHWNFARKAIPFDRLNNFNASHIVAVSEECREFILKNEKAPKTKVSLIHHGISIPELTHQDKKIQSQFIEEHQLAGKIIIGTVARLIEWKGYKIIIEAAEEIIKLYPEIVFLFVGEGPQKEELEQLIQSKNLNKNIVLSGYIDSQYIASVFGIMDIYLHVASYEPFGFVIPEAMVNGIPVISSRTGSALDAIEHKKSGYLLQSRTKSEVVSGIVFMLNSDRKSIGWEGKIIAQNKYSFERMWDNYIQLYEQVLINKNS